MTVFPRITQDELQDIILDNRYDLDDGDLFQMRCPDGNYPNEISLPALTFPGGNTGILAMIYALEQSAGFEIHSDRVLNALITIAGDESKLSCYKSPKPEDLDFAIPFLASIPLSEDRHIDLRKQHGHMLKVSKHVHERDEKRLLEKAIIRYNGEDALFPQYEGDISFSREKVSFYILHQSMLDRYNKQLSHELLRQQAVELFPGCDEEYLYVQLTEISEECFFYSIRSMLPKIPFFTVNVRSSSKIDIIES